MARPQFGDIIEIPTAVGLAYAQFTHKNQLMGPLIRTFDQVFDERPEDLSCLHASPVRFSVFFPIEAAVKRKLLQIVAHIEIASELQEFPLFRDGIADRDSGKVAVWWLWDGDVELRIGDLPLEFRKLPIREIWNLAELVTRIEDGWRPELDPA